MSQNKKGPSYQLLGSPTVPVPSTEPTMFQPYGQQVYFMAGTGINGQPTLSQPVMFIPPPQVQVSRPQSIVPNSHLILTVVLFIILVTFAPETFVFMVPALILAALSHSANGQGKYLRAKYLGNGALALNFCALIFAFVVGILIVSLTISLHPWHRPRDYYRDYYNYYYGCWYDYDFDGSGVPPMICTK